MRRLLDNKIFRIVYGILKWTFVALIILYLLFVFVQRTTGNSSIFGYRVFTIATGSMKPVYNVDDVILVREVDVETIEVGDDIAYLGNRGDVDGLIVTHRVIHIDSENGLRFTLQGINNDSADPSITADQIYGKVEGKIPVINLINHVVKNKYGFFFLVFCPLVLVIFLEIADTIVQAKVDRNELRLIKDENQKDIVHSNPEDSPPSEKSDTGDVDEEII